MNLKNSFPACASHVTFDSIKEGGICEDCPSAWIGSQVAFSAFQEERLNTYPKGKPIHEYT